MLLDLSQSFSVIHVSGQKAREFLQSQLTNDVNLVSDKQIQWQAYCNRQGFVQCIFGLWGAQDDYFLLTPRNLAEPAKTLLEKYAVLSKVQLEVLSPEIRLELVASSQNTLSWTLKSFAKDHMEWTWFVPEALLPKVAKGLNDHMAFRTLLIHHGFSHLSPETVNLFRPHDLNLPALGLVSFKKGCYPGQEIVARTEHLGTPKQGLYHYELEGEQKFLPGQALTANHQVIGKVVDSIAMNGKTYLSAVVDHAQAKSFSGGHALVGL